MQDEIWRLTKIIKHNCDQFTGHFFRYPLHDFHLVEISFSALRCFLDFEKSTGLNSRKHRKEQINIQRVIDWCNSMEENEK